MELYEAHAFGQKPTSDPRKDQFYFECVRRNAKKLDCGKWIRRMANSQQNVTDLTEIRSTLLWS